MVWCCAGAAGQLLPNRRPSPSPLSCLALAQIPELKAAGVDKVVCVTVGDPEAVRKWAADNGFDRDAVRGVARAWEGGMRG